jgi:hypothetical protein
MGTLANPLLEVPNPTRNAKWYDSCGYGDSHIDDAIYGEKLNLAEPEWEDGERFTLLIMALLDQAGFRKSDLDEITALVRQMHPSH